mmetsp:Transcript_61246/g.171271  ORF Transcript_61246/g.171271 Transcript_61246/m.171271 type:complete len:221 (+) Transcript_61246:73-735(+)
MAQRLAYNFPPSRPLLLRNGTNADVLRVLPTLGRQWLDRRAPGAPQDPEARGPLGPWSPRAKGHLDPQGPWGLWGPLVPGPQGLLGPQGQEAQGQGPMGPRLRACRAQRLWEPLRVLRAQGQRRSGRLWGPRGAPLRQGHPWGHPWGHPQASRPRSRQRRWPRPRSPHQFRVRAAIDQMGAPPVQRRTLALTHAALLTRVRIHAWGGKVAIRARLRSLAL